mgnify:CR=1 FL=1
MKHLEKYYAGEGCKCFARSSSECGCHDVDWTPKAVYELRAERDSLQIALEEISNLAKTLKNERDEARVALMKIEDLFIDGTDIYADRETMGEIAREALEGAK